MPRSVCTSSPTTHGDGRNLEVAEALSKYSQFDILLPSQHFRAARKHSPEQRLMIAVLHDALDCVEKYRGATDPQGRRIFQEAKQWLLADETHWPYSFEHICAALDLDSGAVLRRLQVAADRYANPSRMILQVKGSR